jgi:hypothetical protein
MKRIHLTVIAAAIAAALATALYDARQVSRFRDQARDLEGQRDALAGQNRRLQSERDAALARLASAQQAAEHPRAETSELLKLRGEVARLRGESRELARLKASATHPENDPAESEMKSWLDRTKKLKQRLAQSPELSIPEFQFLQDQDWLDAVRKLPQLESEADYAKAIQSLKTEAKSAFATTLQDALSRYAHAYNGQAPADFSQLKLFFGPATDDSVFQGYQFIQPGMVANKDQFHVDQDGNYQSERLQVSLDGVGRHGDSGDALKQAILAYAAANNGQTVSDPALLVPYVQTQDEKKALQRLLPNPAAK